MDNIRQQILQLKKDFDIALKQVEFSRLEEQLTALDKQITAPDFWVNNPKAASVTQQQSKIANRLQPWRALRKSIEELLELSQLPDSDLQPAIEQQLQSTTQEFDLLKEELKFSGKYDEYNAILQHLCWRWRYRCSGLGGNAA